jgi:hypothetical protein
MLVVLEHMKILFLIALVGIAFSPQAIQTNTKAFNSKDQVAFTPPAKPRTIAFTPPAKPRGLNA